ncbi:MAG: EF-hand domain-containing protein [Povalibacter sp.]
MNIRSERGLAAALCVLGALGITSSVAAGDGPGCRDKAAHIDAEGSAYGQISASDHAAGAQKRFEAMDANHDGKITAAEINAAQGAERIAWARKAISAESKIKEFDRDKDGALTAREYADGSQAIFNGLDANSDGYLKADEMEVDPDKVSARDPN